ncbi:hypothetical protein ACQKGA_23700 [Priestia megaterium]|uniref:hypothetical protein n=1 Tax=Priestia megaterium TaxID=1404 RepID=UPI00273173C5|nr:hypothetical protein [Priestia megaterium]MDP1383347.1 hypothetical protein [Priestia megaterium]MDP1427495.1 hypothetical protein [Priestia megaterium]
MDEEMCAYCAKWFPRSKMKQLPDEYPNWYYPACYPEVLAAHRKLPWIRRRYTWAQFLFVSSTTDKWELLKSYGNIFLMKIITNKVTNK